MGGIRIGGIAVVLFGIPYQKYDGGSQTLIWQVPDAGGTPTVVTSGVGTQTHVSPVRSPDRSMIVYLRDNGAAEYELAVVDVAGNDTVIDTGYHRYPNWSPDGSKIIFTSYDAGDTKKVFTINPDGTGRTAIYTSANGSAVLSRAVYNNDGTLIAFQDEQADEIWVMNADGTGATMIDDGTPEGAFNANQDNAISWANGSNRLTYGNGLGAGSGKWIAIDSDGTNRDIIASDTTDCEGIRQAWSSDDSLIIVPDFSLGSGYILTACDPNGGGTTALSPTARVYISGLPPLIFNDRVYFPAYPEPGSSPVRLSSVVVDGSDRRQEDSADGTNILMEFFD